MPCKMSKNNQNCGTRDKFSKIKSKFACIFGSQWIYETAYGKFSIKLYHQYHIAGKGENSLQHYNLVHNFLVPQAMRIPASKAAVDKEWENLVKISAWNLTKVRSNKEVIDEARTKGAKVHFASLMDICHLKKAELETKHLKVQRSGCSPRWYCERWFWIFCSIHWTRIISFTNDSSKSHGYHIQTARVRRTSSRCSIGLHPSKNGRCSQIIENSQIGMPRQ